MFAQLRPALIPFALTAALTGSASAQTVATTFDELGLKVKPGDIIYVTRTDQQETRAKLLELSSSSLVLSIAGNRQQLDESHVMRVRQRLPDSRKNGALIGFLVGGGASTAMAKGLESPAGSCTGGCIAANVFFGGGLGALVGLGIDALIQSRKDIYVRK